MINRRRFMVSSAAGLALTHAGTSSPGIAQIKGRTMRLRLRLR